MSFDRFSNQFTVAAPAEKIFAHLMVPESYIGLSPLVVAVRDVTPAGDGSIVYTAIERFKLGPFKWDNPIRVTLTGVPDSRVTSSVKSPGGVTLVSTTDLVADGDSTTVTDTIEVTSPWLLRWFVVGQARKVQLSRAAELDRRLARPAE